MATDWELDEFTTDDIRFPNRCHTPLVSEVYPRMNRAILLAHYDRDGIIDPYVIAAAREYRRFADTLVLISVSTKTLPRDVSEIVDVFIHRENIGYDFGSWKAGLLSLGDIDRFEEILFVNDSIYGPLFDLTPALNHTRTSRSDLWGMVRSEQHADHIQSWFFAARSSLIRSHAYSNFWGSAGEQFSHKNEFIFRQEIGLSTSLRSAGFQIDAIYDSRDEPLAKPEEIRRHLSPWSPLRSMRHLRKSSPPYAPFNASELFYARLWDAGVPYIKRRIFTENYYGLDLRKVQAELETLSPDWAMLIRSHRQRMGRH